MFEWVSTNWQGIALVFFILYSIASEVIGMSSLKENIIEGLAIGLTQVFSDNGVLWVIG